MHDRTIFTFLALFYSSEYSGLLQSPCAVFCFIGDKNILYNILCGNLSTFYPKVKERRDFFILSEVKERFLVLSEVKESFWFFLKVM